MYIQADLKAKEQALGKLQPVEGGFPRFKPDDALLAFLSGLMPSAGCRVPRVDGSGAGLSSWVRSA
jgi:hypothetical protein